MVFENIKCILILGATASGKTSLAHNLADKLSLLNKPCELVNLDAFQIYKELNIGTAKPSLEEINRYHYHGIDVCELNENLDANSFATLAHKACKSIIQKNRIPICVGGSGLYLRSFLHGLDKLPPRDENIRNQIKQEAQVHGWPHCHAWLKSVDPVRAEQLHPNDKTRIERALEIFLLTGKPQSVTLSKANILKEQSTLFPCFVIHCKKNPEELKTRIHKRVEQLFIDGWIEEVEQLFKMHGKNLNAFHSLQALGYKQILEYLNLHNSTLNPISYNEDLIQKISTLTWHYAKKQQTWIAKEKVDFEYKCMNHEEDILLLEKINEFLTST